MKKLLCALGLLLIPGVLLAQAPIAADAISASSTDCTVASSCVLLRFPPGTASVGVQIAGTFSETLLFEATLDGVNFTAVGGTPIAGGAIVTSATAAGVWQFGVAGLQELRVRCSVFASGQASVVILGTQGMPGAATAIASFTAVGNKVEVVDGSNNVLPTTASGPVVPSSADGIVVSYEALTSGGITTAMTATTSTVVVSATAAQYIYIDHCTVSNASTTVSTDISLQDGSGGTIIWNIPAPAASVATTGGGGADVSWPNHPLKVPTAGNGLFAANVTTGSSTKIFCSGFKSAISY
jgi:hypothetical protein